MKEKSQFKNTLITGASSGIGRNLALEFASRGHNLVLIARRIDLLSTLKKEIEDISPVQVVIQAVDIRDEIGLRGALSKAQQQIGPLDTVVANAGFGVAGRLDELTLSDFERQFDVNVFGVLKTIYASIDSLKSTRGRLCLIGSTSSYMTIPGNSAYCMSKFAIRSLAESLNVELSACGVSVTLINPGFIKTDIRKIDNDGIFKATRTDPVPEWLMMDAGLAGRKIYKAIAKRERERALTIHSRLGIIASRFFPSFVAYALKTISKPT